ncbi:MAG TPA: hypothetical protein ENN07_00720 [candidate division Zixibacteria bacterium]|nr:hypothetical protein [candidate division Zixibacteria bacterium]
MNRVLPFILPIVFILAFNAILPAPILDDAFITAHVARNLAEGEGMVHNSGERVFAVTTVAWTLLNAGLRALGMDSLLAMRLLSILSEIALAIILTKLGGKALGDIWSGAIAAILLTTSLGFIVSSFGGMEIALSMAFIAWAFLALGDENPSQALILSAFAVWVRFDNLLLLGFVFTWVLFDKKIKLELKYLIAPAVIISVYMVGATLYFGTPVPVSVLRKAAIPGQIWHIGALAILRHFLKAIVGNAEPLIHGNSPHWLILVPLAFGMYYMIRDFRRKLTPVGLFLLVYIFAWTLTGKQYATLFTWYFIPPLLGVYLICGHGVVVAIDSIKNLDVKKWTALVLVLAWFVVTSLYSHSKMVEFRDTTHARRERTYASASIWLGENLPAKSTICAGEIGAIKFYARKDTYVLDWVGLTRPLSDKRPPVNLVAEERPEAIIYWPLEGQAFNEIADIYTNYSFGEINGVMIGVRDDLADDVFDDAPRLFKIFETIDITRENPL